MTRLSAFAFACLLPLLSIGEEIVVRTSSEKNAAAVFQARAPRGTMVRGHFSPRPLDNG